MNTTPNGERLLTLGDVRDRLQISRVTAWRLHAERGLRVVRIGRAIRVRESDLAAWLEKNATGNGSTSSEARAASTDAVE